MVCIYCGMQTTRCSEKKYYLEIPKKQLIFIYYNFIITVLEEVLSTMVCIYCGMQTTGCCEKKYYLEIPKKTTYFYLLQFSN